MSAFDWTALAVTVRLALWTTLILTVFGLPLAAWLAGPPSRAKTLVSTVATLPIVLPPTVLGFYVLMAIGPSGTIGQLAGLFGITLPFTFGAVVLGSVLYNLPFTIRPFTAALAGVDQRYLEAASCLGAGPWRRFFGVWVPLAGRGLTAGIILTAAHAVGEFGVVLMLGGNIPGVSRTLAVVIYDDAQALDLAAARQTSVLLLAFAFVTMGALSWLERPRRLTR